MGDEAIPLDVRRIAAGTADYRVALHMALDVRPPAGDQHAPQVASILKRAEDGRHSVDLLFGVYAGNRLVTAVAGLTSPGAMALILFSSDLLTAERRLGVLAALKAVLAASQQRSIAILEALISPESQSQAKVLSEVGFRRLTCLRYLQRPVAAATPDSKGRCELDWVSYSPETELLFERIVEQTYVQTQDCPELSGLMPVSAVVAGHRATGVFEPGLWWTAVRDGDPVGVMLLSRLASDPALEIVYMGVAQPARRQGVAHALLDRAVACARSNGATGLTLAVDERNAPAVGLYERWGFTEFGVRDAWIASPVLERSWRNQD